MSIETGQAEPAVTPDEVSPKKRSRLKRWLLIGFGVAVLLFAGAVADTYWQAYQTVDSLKQVADSLSAAKSALAKGRLPGGDPFTRAEQAVQAIRNRLDHARPDFGLIGGVPFVGRPVVAVRKLLSASENEVAAAIATKNLLNEMTGGALTARSHPSGPKTSPVKCSRSMPPRVRKACKAKQKQQSGQGPGAGAPQSPLFANGTLDVARLVSFRPQLERVVARLRAAEAAVEAVPTAPFISKLTTLKEGILAQVSQVARAGQSALLGMKLIPALFGQGGARTYFVAFGDLSHIRGGGGSTLAFAILRIDHGKITISQVKQIFRVLDRQVNVPVPVPADDWYLRDLEPLVRIGDANDSPNFPSSAVVMAEIYEKISHQHLDGVIQLDAPAVAGILRATGPITVPQWPTPIHSSDVARIAYIDSHIQLPRATNIRKEMLSQMVQVTFQRIADPANGIQVLGNVVALGRGLAEKHLQVWLSRPSEEAFASRLGWTGAIRRGPSLGDYLLVAEQSLTFDSLAFFAKQEVDHTVNVLPSGDLDVTTTVKLYSDVPQQYRVRPIFGQKGGSRHTLVNLYAPGDARLRSIRYVDSHGHEFAAHGVMVHTEAGKHVFSATLVTRGGRATELVFHYVVPHGLVEVNGQKVYRLTMQIQPQMNPDSLHLAVNLPSGMGFGNVRKPVQVNGATATLERLADRDFSVGIPLG